MEPTVVLGAESYVRAHLESKVADIKALVKTMLTVSKVAAGAFNAERLLFRVPVREP